MKERRGSAGGGVFPFSLGCMSQSAVAVADPAEKKPPQGQGAPSSSSSSAAATAGHQAAGAGDDGEAAVKEEKAAAATAASPGLVAAGVSRLMKGIRSLSQMFSAYDGDGGEDDDEEDQEREMVIGYPTDVQHVGHIGWDGGHSSKVGMGATAMGMVNAFSLPSTLSLRQLEMAMDHHHHHAAAAQASSV